MSGQRNVARVGDLCTGHECYPPRPIATGSMNVFTNGRGTVRVGDEMTPHLCVPGEKPHYAYLRKHQEWEHSTTVFVNHRIPCYIRAEVDHARISPIELLDPDRDLKQGEESVCNVRIMTGSNNVFFDTGMGRR